MGDVESEIVEAIEHYAKKVDLCFVTGGLGPTNDDITKDTICKIWSDELIWRPEIEQELRRWFLKKGKQPNPMSLAQANVPSKAHYVVNQLGTAPALILKKGNCHFVFMPGVPAEVHGFCNSFFKTWLNAFEIKQNVLHKHLYTTGMSESTIAKRLIAFEAKLPKEISLAYLPDYITVRLRLTALFDSGKEANLPIEQLFQELKTELKDIILFEGEHSLAEELARELIAQNKTVSTAESCTSGALSSVLTSISGSSQYFYGAVVAYDNKIKAAFEAYKSVNSLTTRSAGATVSAQFVANAGVTLSQLLLASETNPSALLASDTLAALMTQFELTELAHVTLQGVITLNADAENAAEGHNVTVHLSFESGVLTELVPLYGVPSAAGVGSYTPVAIEAAVRETLPNLIDREVNFVRVFASNQMVSDFQDANITTLETSKEAIAPVIPFTVIDANYVQVTGTITLPLSGEINPK